MIINLYNGGKVFVNPNYIVAIEEAGTSSQWHGIRSYVICELNGRKISYECRDTLQELTERMT